MISEDRTSARLSRLCRLRCGRSPTFRHLTSINRGYAPDRGVAPKGFEWRPRWGRATTAHQAAEPQVEAVRTNRSTPSWFTVSRALTISLMLIAFAGRVGAQQMQIPENADFSKFQHETAYHARLPCLLCHRRENNSAQPAFPGASKHLPCAGCHLKQFADSSNAICTICHKDVQSGALKRFPGLKSFNMKFDHARHMNMDRIGCATCHRPSRAGVALTIPAGFIGHVTCFQCHGPQARSGNRDISSCGVCHQAGRYVRLNQTAPAFRVGFSHAKHDRDEGLGCRDCHRIRPGLQRKEMTSPQPLNHHASAGSLSCMSCHDGKKAFGGDDFSACKRCHVGKAWRF